MNHRAHYNEAGNRSQAMIATGAASSQRRPSRVMATRPLDTAPNPSRCLSSSSHGRSQGVLRIIAWLSRRGLFRKQSCPRDPFLRRDEPCSQEQQGGFSPAFMAVSHHGIEPDIGCVCERNPSHHRSRNRPRQPSRNRRNCRFWIGRSGINSQPVVTPPWRHDLPKPRFAGPGRRCAL